MSTVYIKNSEGKTIGYIFTSTHTTSYSKPWTNKTAYRERDSAPVARYDSKLGFTTNALTNERRNGDATLAMLMEYDLQESYHKKATQLSQSSASAYSTVSAPSVISYAGSFSLGAFLGYCLVGVGIAYFVSSDVDHMLRLFVGFIGKFL